MAGYSRVLEDVMSSIFVPRDYRVHSTVRPACDPSLGTPNSTSDRAREAHQFLARPRAEHPSMDTTRLSTDVLAIDLLACVLGLGAGPDVGPAAGDDRAPARRPNVVVIITDDQGHGDLGFHGNPKIRTPHLDQLARESVRIDRF